MSFQQEVFPTDSSDQEFYEVIEFFKTQNVLPHDSFVRTLPFFNFPEISKESQIKELFESSFDAIQSRVLLQNANLMHDNAEETFSCALTNSPVMSFAQVALYKVLPCPYKACPRYPREIATHNQYTDPEYECPFYHHERDRRRLVMTSNMEEEFVYKANYYEEKRRFGDKDKYSQNYFESMFHPLYYKMFKCKRHYCNSSKFCPFFHHEDEKRAWDNSFRKFVKKDRGSYVKDKQKYYEGQAHNSQAPEQRTFKNESIENRGDYHNRFHQKNFKNKRQGFQQPPQSNGMKNDKDSSAASSKYEGNEENVNTLIHAFYRKSKEQEVC